MSVMDTQHSVMRAHSHVMRCICTECRSSVIARCVKDRPMQHKHFRQHEILSGIIDAVEHFVVNVSVGRQSGASRWCGCVGLNITYIVAQHCHCI